MAALDSAAVAEVDTTGQAADILGLPDHLEDALWRVEAASLQPAGTAGGLIVAGMGGSGVGGALARAALWAGLARPLELVRGADLPAWSGPDTLVLCSSYSGNTEETLAAYDAAGEAGAPRVVSSSGGELPARALHETVPVIAGSGPAAAAAYRWKCQLNENAKLPAFSAELPEAGHNEIVGWSEASDLARFAAVFLEDPGTGERMQVRIELTAEIVGAQAAVVERVTPRGETPLQRLVSHILLGDLVSLYLAVLSGTDPFGVEPIDRLKAGLAAR